MMLLLIAAVAAAPISLSTVTGGMIADECSHSEGLKLDVCASYVLGVADTLQLEHKTCRPPSEAATLQTLRARFESLSCVAVPCGSAREHSDGGDERPRG